MLMKKPAHRIFDYQPRFYKPEEDEKERKKRHLGFARKFRQGRRKRSTIIWVVLLLLAIYVYLRLIKFIW